MNGKMKLVVAMTLMVSLTACGQRLQTRGYIFDKELADAIQPGVDNKQSVQATMGTPTLLAAFSDQTWYYVSTNVEVKPLFLPTPKWRRVMSVSFNEQGVVTGVENYDLSHARAIDPVDDKTPTKGKQLGFFQQLFMNVGRFSGQQPVGGPGGPGPNGS
ncbi:outer membrane protein assembly factor BamE [Temperatibacter marinus]|uniref:Outer membrane protein assembly factor BamE n=1 Tax=Temperatibacter marinus TaxID=1456591 RepID=A0AA52EFM9_9PROT|nr:outer membrane protein assembly factor BamE [Temperatibacter marinus]WND02238.1 outer membrane protein assembly factor BamE [Temperatibacter marinus]